MRVIAVHFQRHVPWLLMPDDLSKVARVNQLATRGAFIEMPALVPIRLVPGSGVLGRIASSLPVNIASERFLHSLTVSANDPVRLG
jgi:hypothetical protein